MVRVVSNQRNLRSAMPEHGKGIAETIALAEAEAMLAQDAEDGVLAKPAIWFAMKEATAHLRELTGLRGPGIDEDCRVAGCGTYGRSITGS